jgi:uncharacterized protein (TIGR01777 family)
MNILITGGTGFIGSKLCTYLSNIGHNLTVKTRNPALLSPSTKYVSYVQQLNENDSFDVVINLAGQPIADKRWSQVQKDKILNSRIDTTKQLIQFFNSTKHKPSVFISSSAIGYYGIEPTQNKITEVATGNDNGDDSFSSQLCQQWEKCALEAEQLGIRTCLLRTGIVLGKGGGALKKMLLPFKLGLGGKIGSGKQWMPWIHMDDMIGLIDLCINNDNISGPINCTAPNPVTNLTFTEALANTLNRPAIFPMPAFMVNLLMGQMGQELLLSGKNIIPKKALKHGYQFKYEKLDQALGSILS